ncbi:MAG: hypothetical protein ACP6IP_08030 [Candidatus Njordarchaeia archaeon]
MVELLDDTVDLGNIKLRRIKENLTETYVPDPLYYKKLRTQYLPSALPVWYNPKMEINRDITILALYTYFNHFGDGEEITYFEGLGGTGVRGFRIYNELVLKEKIPINIVLNDINPEAHNLIKFNWEKIGAPNEIKVFYDDFNHLLLNYRKNNEDASIDVVEIDPYGSPMPFTASTAQVLKGKNGMLLASSTDLAPLHGKYPLSALRKYSAWVSKNKFDSEVATRVLIYALGKEFSIFSKKLDVLFAVIHDGFIKVIATARKGKLKANEFWSNIGFLAYNVSDPYKSKFVKNLEDAAGFSDVKLIGPLWISTMCNVEFCQEMLENLNRIVLSKNSKRTLERYLKWAIEGSDMPLYVDIHEMSRKYKMKPPSMDTLINALKEKGVKCTRTYFNYRAVKIDSLELAETVLKETMMELQNEK